MDLKNEKENKSDRFAVKSFNTILFLKLGFLDLTGCEVFFALRQWAILQTCGPGSNLKFTADVDNGKEASD